MSVVVRRVRRTVAVLLLGLTVSGAVVIGASSPASAAPTARFVDGCNFVRLLIDSNTVRPLTPYVVLRNGSEADAGKTSSGDYLTAVTALPGDSFELVLDGVSSGTHSYLTPEGCTEPKVEITFENACYNTVIIRIRNVGAVYVTRFFMPSEFGNVWFSGVFPGESEYMWVTPPEPTRPTVVGWAATEGVPITVATHTYQEPVGCGPAALTVQLTALCDNRVRIDVTNRAQGRQPFQWEPSAYSTNWVDANADAVRTQHLKPGQTIRVFYPSPEGPDTLLAEYTYAVPAHCLAQPQENASGLPTTGANTTLLAGLGLVLTLAGIGTYLAGRRRRETPAGGS